MTHFDDIVIGLGLAGAAVAWHLRWRGRRVLLMDRGVGGASRVAAGLVTPVTGMRLVKTWRLDELLPVAAAFYRRVEADTGTALFTQRNAVRLLASAGERDVLARRRADAAYRGLIPHLDPPINEEWFAAPHGAFEMASAARLDVGRYLDATRDHFAATGDFLTADVDPGRDVELTPGGVALPRLGAAARRLIFCQGLDARSNSWLPDVRFTPAKGEVLTLRIPGLREERVVHHGVWLAPAGSDHFRAGATYDRDDLTPAPTDRGRDEILTRLRAFLRLPVEVVGHAAGVRPVVAGGQPVCGVHPAHPQLAHLNGLGSKGVLLAPHFAARLAAELDG